jgi:putative hydrolase of the HAD superfamily
VKEALTKELDQFKLVVFDLDHTLYNEHNYLFQAYESIGRKLEVKTGIPSDDITDFLRNRFKNYGRHLIFDQMRMHFKLHKNVTGLCIDVLRGVKPKHKLELFDCVLETFDYLLANGKQIAILTNGHPRQQRNKIEHINWHGYKDKIKIYLAAEIEPKPSPAGLFQILHDFKMDPEEIAFVGDAHIDESCAIKAGVKFFYV